MPGYYSDYGDGRGNGYDHVSGMSHNALDAYDRGVKPLSRVTAQDLKEAGWSQTKSLAMYLASENFWISAEWHHSGGEWFNRVDFYDPSALVAKWAVLGDSARENWSARHKESKVKSFGSDGEKVVGSYTVWGGSRRRPRRLREQAFTGHRIGNWIHLDDGGRKKASGSHITWRAVEGVYDG